MCWGERLREEIKEPVQMGSGGGEVLGGRG